MKDLQPILTFYVRPGAHIDHVAAEMCKYSFDNNVIARARFNEVDLETYPFSEPKEIVDYYDACCKEISNERKHTGMPGSKELTQHEPN